MAPHYTNKIPEAVLERLAIVSRHLIKKAKQAGPRSGWARFSPYTWVQRAANRGDHPEAMAQALERLNREAGRVLNPWAYLNKIIKDENPNKHENDFIRRGEQEKKELGMTSVGAGLAEMLLKAMEKGQKNDETD